MTEPIKKGAVEGAQALRRKPWPALWRVLDWLGRAFFPLILIAIVVGFEAAIVVQVFEYVWNFFR